MKNIILVEGKNDKIFYEFLIKNLFSEYNINLSEVIKNDKINCNIESLNSKSKLKPFLINFREENINNKIPLRVGVIWDRDEEEIKVLKEEIKTIFDNVFKNYPAQNGVIPFVFSENYKEVEYYLKDIKSQDSKQADCFYETCELNEKEAIKEWLRIYLRFDCCSKKLKKKSVNNCFFEAVFKCDYAKDFFDFNRQNLVEFQNFLNNFKE